MLLALTQLVVMSVIAMKDLLVMAKIVKMLMNVSLVMEQYVEVIQYAPIMYLDSLAVVLVDFLVALVLIEMNVNLVYMIAIPIKLVGTMLEDSLATVQLDSARVMEIVLVRISNLKLYLIVLKCFRYR